VQRLEVRLEQSIILPRKRDIELIYNEDIVRPTDITNETVDSRDKELLR